jgi:hypothetical protein
MFVEYDWTFDCYRFRIGSVFTDWRGWQSLPTLEEVRHLLRSCGCKLGRKTDDRTWPILSPGEGEVV